MTLVVIDLQRVFGDPSSPWCAPRFGSVVEPVSRLVAAFGDDVVFTRFVAPAEPVGAWVDYYREFPFALQPPDAPLYDLVDAFAGRPTLDATTFGKWGPELAARVTGDLVVAGVSTDCCVISTVLAAADAGRRVRVVADACAGADDASHDKALDVMGLFAPLVQITDVDTVLASPS
ncbi:cysteine hydrolase family protein [Jatrophihabitans endophyticus]|uniref:cysteine hydrolase family protein n=1 Tax=Jatrophihabitans endophyticus TaxID=1206085 RepID=UPI0019F455AE|nr:isochorismatase family protein [Jatrophihabitans endophyticus]MBE7187910.1 isochorismatase family protein [Jatrophihabitans endophyticus]